MSQIFLTVLSPRIIHFLFHKGLLLEPSWIEIWSHFCFTFELHLGYIAENWMKAIFIEQACPTWMYKS